MATPPVFSAGAVLTAAQMNAVGLWLIKSQTIGNAVSSVTVSDVFSSDFDAYKIIGSGGAGSAETNIRLQLGSTTTGYYGFMAYGSYAGTTVSGTNDNNASLFSHVGGADTGGFHLDFDLISPYLSKSTEVGARARYSTVYGNYVGVQGSNTSFTGFTISTAAGTLTGGTIRVYGYRN